MREDILTLNIRGTGKYINIMSGFGYSDEDKEIYDEIYSQGFFEFKKDIHILAAVIGFNLYSSNLEEIKNYKLKPINILQVDYSEYYHLIYSIAISLEDKIEETISLQDIVEKINKCAALGIKKLEEILTEDNENYIRNFEDFLEYPERSLKKMFDREKEINEVIESSNWS
ncbi:MAG: hypothetical protein ACRDB9_09340 [Cetobacterium sp.]